MKKEYTLSQKKAIAWNTGALIVLAGPGSGKTAVLTERIGRLLSDTPEENFKILALTFTNKAAMEMSDRILKIVPDAKGRLFVGTFHGFCAEVLRNHGSYIGIKSDFEIYSDENDLRAIIDELQDEYFNEFGDGTIYDLKLLNAIKYFQENLCFTEEQVDEKMPKTAKASIFKWIYLHYQKRLIEMNSLDYNSIILLTYQLFSTYPQIAKIYRISYKYVCVDEFQDTNLAQYNLIKSFVPTEKSNVFIVADDDQVIYGWNGASNKRILEFKKDYSAELIQLCENFRCPEDVVQAANNLITNNSGRVGNKAPLVAMKSISSVESVISINNFDNENDEFQYVASEIKRIKSCNYTETIGVIARNNKLLQKQYEILQNNGIQCVKSKRKDDFENKYIRLIHLCLKIANRRGDKKILVDVIDGFNNVFYDKIEPNEILTMCKINGDDYLTGLCMYLDKVKSKEFLTQELKVWLLQRNDYKTFVEKAFDLADDIINQKANELNDDHKNSFIDEYNTEKNVWNNISQQISINYDADVPLSTFLQEFSMASKDDEPKPTDVQCLTIHASKGKEFDNVFLIGLVEDELPSFQSIKCGDTSIEMEEERRNCFVAITRTKSRLYLTYAKRYNGWLKQRSRFIDEMGV